MKNQGCGEGNILRPRHGKQQGPWVVLHEKHNSLADNELTPRQGSPGLISQSLTVVYVTSEQISKGVNQAVGGWPWYRGSAEKESIYTHKER